MCKTCSDVSYKKFSNSPKSSTSLEKSGAVNDIRLQIASISQNVAKILEQQTAIDNRLASMQNDLQQQISALTLKVTELENENRKLTSLLGNFNFRLNTIEQNKLLNNIEICGIEKTSEENLVEIVKTLSIKVGATIKEDNIIKVYRKPSRNSKINGNTPSIIAVIDDSSLKEEFIKKCRKIKALNTSVFENQQLTKRPLYVNHELTKTSQFLLAKAKEKKNQKLINFVWVKKGNIMIRKNEGSPPIKVFNLTQLNYVTQP